MMSTQSSLSLLTLESTSLEADISLNTRILERNALHDKCPEDFPKAWAEGVEKRVYTECRHSKEAYMHRFATLHKQLERMRTKEPTISAEDFASNDWEGLAIMNAHRKQLEKDQMERDSAPPFDKDAIIGIKFKPCTAHKTIACKLCNAGMLTCRSCKSTDVSWETKQDRSGDEGMSAYCTCKTCGVNWRIRG